MKPPIIIYKLNGLFRAKLVNQENGKTVGTTSQGYDSFGFIIGELSVIRNAQEFEIYEDKAGKFRFRIGYRITRDSDLIKAIRSEPYASKQKAEQGIESCKRCLEIGLVALEFSEDTNYYSLDDLAANPGLGIVHT